MEQLLNMAQQPLYIFFLILSNLGIHDLFWRKLFKFTCTKFAFGSEKVQRERAKYKMLLYDLHLYLINALDVYISTYRRMPNQTLAYSDYIDT